MKKQKPVRHSHRRSMIAEKKSKGKFSKCHLPKSKTIKNSCNGNEIGFFFMHICKHCHARGKSACDNCVIWR